MKVNETVNNGQCQVKENRLRAHSLPQEDIKVVHQA